jgi:ligand-binding sensor domain-containing protein
MKHGEYFFADNDGLFYFKTRAQSIMVLCLQ